MTEASPSEVLEGGVVEQHDHRLAGAAGRLLVAYTVSKTLKLKISSRIAHHDLRIEQRQRDPPQARHAPAPSIAAAS